MKTTSVLVVVLNWKQAQKTAECLHSIQHQQTSANLRLLIIDNDSGDGSEAFLRNEFPDIELIQTGKNLGFGGGVNYGLRRAIDLDTDFVWLLNNDAKALDNTLAALLRIAESDEKVGIIGGKIINPRSGADAEWGGGLLNLTKGRARHLKPDEYPLHLDYVTGASMLLRVDMLKEIGLFDEQAFFMYWEDADLCQRAKNEDWQLSLAADSIIEHEESISSGGVASPGFYRLYNQSAIVFFSRHGEQGTKTAMIGAKRRFKNRLKSNNYHAAWAILTSTPLGLWKAYQATSSTIQPKPNIR